GASGQFRQDQVTVYLRAVSTQSGRVLKTVHTTKTIVSQKVDAGIFRYVDPKRILESEVGYTFNEPPVLAVTEAIQESVRALIIEGVRDSLWELADARDATSDAFLAYDRERADAASRTYFDRAERNYRSGFAIGLLGGTQRYQGNYMDPLAEATGELQIIAGLTERLSLQTSFSGGRIAAQDAFRTTQFTGDVLARYVVLPRERLSPYVTAGAGIIAQDQSSGVGEPLVATVAAGAGIEYMLTRGIGFSLDYRFDYTLDDRLDGIRSGRLHDSVWSLRTGLTFYSSLF
ncbi:MAG TPA: CsgG/HfaB family protein, partial [Rhodothermales bacterium]